MKLKQQKPRKRKKPRRVWAKHISKVTEAEAFGFGVDRAAVKRERVLDVWIGLVADGAGDIPASDEEESVEMTRFDDEGEEDE